MRESDSELVWVANKENQCNGLMITTQDVFIMLTLFTTFPYNNFFLVVGPKDFKLWQSCKKFEILQFSSNFFDGFLTFPYEDFLRLRLIYLSTFAARKPFKMLLFL